MGNWPTNTENRAITKQSELAEKKPLLALDVGDARIGVAVSQNQILAHPLCTIQRRAIPADVVAVVELIDKYEPAKIVVGLPLKWDGQISIQGQKIKDFVDLLALAIQIEIVFWDERGTTIQAKKIMITNKTRRNRKKKKVDQIAAALILEDYLQHLQVDGGD